MRMWMMWTCLLSASVMAVAEEVDGDRKVPAVDAMISERVGELPAPEAPAVGKGVTMAMTTSEQAAQDHVQHGLACLHAGWDFEGYRHFCAALKKDPDFLMAHVGVLLSLLQADLGYAEEKEAAMNRLLALAEANVGTDLEQRYAFGVVKLMRDGPGEAASVFNRMVEDFPNDPQAVLFKSLLGRGGHDDLGGATPDQVRAEEELRAVVEKYPDVPYLLYGLLAIRAESPMLKPDLPLARKLVEMAPDFGPYQHLLGHYEWRCGNHAKAHEAFAKASDFFAKWMEANGIAKVDCPEWTKSECYRAVAYASKGDYDTALKVAEAVAAIDVSAEQAATTGGRMLLWEGKTLPIRILLRRAAAGDYQRAFKRLPTKQEAEDYGKGSLVVWSFQAYSSILAGRLSLADGKREDAQLVAQDLGELGARFVQTREMAAAAGERSPWLRSFRAMEVMSSELLGLIAMAGPADGIGSAFNWYRSAADRQRFATLMLPPAVLLPMEVRLGEYYMERRDWNRAIEVMIAGQHHWPNDWELLHQLQLCFHKAGMKADADDVAKRLEQLNTD